MTLAILSALWMYMMLSMTLPMHPLSLGIMVLLLAFINCTLIASISPWYSYMLFFIFIGGMLVMFAYIMSLSPNMAFSLNNSMMPISLTLISIVIFKDSSSTSNYTIYTNLGTSIKDSILSLSFLYTKNGMIYVILLACVLLFTLVACVKICKPKRGGALRPFLM
uniref:NADH dehydrogenase subunit 6 n=1 Tax=Sinanodonta tumens TaxID=2706138 RepID=A0A7R7EF96_9BIVA|nr:NADH dehydrogenase subunit 6 [Sinanodonta tumens]